MFNNIKLENLNTLLMNGNANFSILMDNKTIKTAEEGAALHGITLNETTPTLILKTKEGYFAAIICADTRISFKKLKLALGVKDVSLASPETVLSIVDANVGEVCLINSSLTTLIDSRVMNNDYCYGGTGVPQTTLKIKTEDLVRMTNGRLIDFTDIRE